MNVYERRPLHTTLYFWLYWLMLPYHISGLLSFFSFNYLIVGIYRI